MANQFTNDTLDGATQILSEQVWTFQRTGGLSTGVNTAQSNQIQKSVTPPAVTTVVNPSGSNGFPKALLSASAVESPSIQGDRVFAEVSVSFTRDGSDPNFGSVRVWFTGYQGSSTPVLMASGTTSPITFLCEATGETVVVTVQPVSPSGITASLAFALTGTVTLGGVVTAPPGPSITQSLVNTPTGYQFSFNFLTGLLTDIIANYRVYRNTSNTTAGATVIQAIVQNTNSAASSYVVQDNIGSQSATTYYYWVSAVNTSGLESSLTAAQAGTVANGGWIIPPQYGTTVVVDNANFEASAVLTAGAPPGWIANSATLSYETGSPYAGTQSLKVAASVTGGGAKTAQIWSCKAGDQFYISAAQKSDGTSTPNTVLIFFDTTGTFIGGGGASHGTGTSWTIDTGSVTAPAGAVTFYVTCANALSGGGGVCFFDQVLVDRMTDPSTTLAPKGSTPYSLSGAFTYTSTTTTVTVSWSSIVIYRNDNTTTALTNGSQLVTGLLASHTYYVYPYYDDTFGGTAPLFISSVGGASGTPPICWAATSVLLAQAQNLMSRIPLNNGGMTVVTPASGSGGGSGGGGGGGGCFTGNTRIKTIGRAVKFDSLPNPVWIENETGTHIADVLVHEGEWDMLDMGDGELVTLNHLFKVDKKWITADLVFPNKPRVKHVGKVYNLHVRTDASADRHYVLENGRVVHNFKPL